MTNKKWTVEFLDEQVEKTYIELIKSGALTLDDNRLLKKWVSLIENEGPKVLERISFWNDHALDGEWSGYRSSSFSKLGRIIYEVVDNRLMVYVVRVTPDHDYKRSK